MTDLQRYAMTGYDSTDAWLAPDDEGNWVSHADAEAAIAAAEQSGRESAYADYLHQKEPFAVWCMEQGERNQRAVFESLIDAAFAKGVWQGQRDMLAKCIAAVDAAVAEWESEWSIDDIYRALHAIQEKP